MGQSWTPAEEDYKQLFHVKKLNPAFKMYTQVKKEENDKDKDISPEEQYVIDQLMELTLLNEVPFAYLAPYEKMIEADQIRFFYLDPNWIRIMLDGACSIGRFASVDCSHDARFIEEVYKMAVGQNENVRRGKLELDEIVADADTLLEVPCTGFLLRSQLVTNWRGLEFEAYEDAKDGKMKKLTALRLEQLAPDMLIGIYRGVINRLEVKEPTESFHYGFRKDEGRLSKLMRSLKDGKLLPDQDPASSITVHEKGNRVIDFAATADEMAKNQKLFPNGATAQDVTSAHMAVEMIQNAYSLIITSDTEGEKQDAK